MLSPFNREGCVWGQGQLEPRAVSSGLAQPVFTLCLVIPSYLCHGIKVVREWHSKPVNKKCSCTHHVLRQCLFRVKQSNEHCICYRDLAFFIWEVFLDNFTGSGRSKACLSVVGRVIMWV